MKLLTTLRRCRRTFIKKLTESHSFLVGIAERKEREKELRRHSIIDAAERVFFQKGVDEATMDDVAAEAELSKGTLYLYFKSKIELLAAIHVRGMDMLSDKMDVAMQLPGSGLEMLQRLAHVFVRYSVEHPEYFNVGFIIDKMHSTDQISGGPWLDECQHRNDDILRLTVTAIERGISDGSISRRYQPHQLAFMLWAGVRGIVHVYHIKKTRQISEFLSAVQEPLDQLIQGFFMLLSNGIAAGAPDLALSGKAHKTAS